jgi:hypothetical protein
MQGKLSFTEVGTERYDRTMTVLALTLMVLIFGLIGVACWKIWDNHMLTKRRFKSWNESLLPITVFFGRALSIEGVASLREAIEDMNEALGFKAFDSGSQIEDAVQQSFEERLGLSMPCPKGILLYAPCSEADGGLTIKLVRDVEGYIEFAFVRVPLYIEYTTESVYRLLFIVLGLDHVGNENHMIEPADLAKLREALAAEELGEPEPGSEPTQRGFFQTRNKSAVK